MELEKYPLNTERNLRITEALIKMVCLDFEAFRIVERKGFQAFMSVLEPRYAIPTRQSLTYGSLNKLYEEICAQVLHKMKEADYIHVTTDMWTECHKQISYMTVTVHFCDKSMQLFTYCISTCEFEDAHTGENIYFKLKDIFAQWQISEKIYSVVTDNGANVVKTAKTGKWYHLPCFAHTINLVVKDALEKQEQTINVINSCRRIVHIFKSSTKASNILRKEQEDNGLEPKTLKKDCDT